jgi:hypothetical protein
VEGSTLGLDVLDRGPHLGEEEMPTICEDHKPDAASDHEIVDDKEDNRTRSILARATE